MGFLEPPLKERGHFAKAFSVGNTRIPSSKQSAKPVVADKTERRRCACDVL